MACCRLLPSFCLIYKTDFCAFVLSLCFGTAPGEISLVSTNVICKRFVNLYGLSATSNSKNGSLVNGSQKCYLKKIIWDFIRN